MPELNELLAAYTALIDRYHKTLDLVSEAGRQAFASHRRRAGLRPPDRGRGRSGRCDRGRRLWCRVTWHRHRRSAAERQGLPGGASPTPNCLLELASGNLGLDNTEVFGGDVLISRTCAPTLLPHRR